jgi:putative membrane protein
MDFIIQLLVNAGILLILAYMMPSVAIKNFTTAILVALVVGILNATIGYLLRLPLNIVTLGLLSFVIRLLVTAVMIKIADKFFTGFIVKGFLPAVIIAVVIAIVGSVLSLG